MVQLLELTHLDDYIFADTVANFVERKAYVPSQYLPFQTMPLGFCPRVKRKFYLQKLKKEKGGKKC